MNPIFGRTFRRQEHELPWGQRCLLYSSILVCVVATCYFILNTAQFATSFYRSLAPEYQASLGRLAALLIGWKWLLLGCKSWRWKLYLNPPLRDLSVTPGSPDQVLRVALRLGWKSPQIGTVVIFTLALYHLVWWEWMDLAQGPEWDWFYPVLPFMSTLVALAFSSLLVVLLDAVAIALNVTAAAVGLGGAAPKLARSAQLLSIASWLIGYALWFLSVCAILVLLEVLERQEMWQLPLWYTGRLVLDFLATPPSLLLTAYRCFPTVAWFDALTSIGDWRVADFTYGALVCSAWLAGSAAALWAFQTRGYSFAARCPWDGGLEAPRPADAVPPEKRPFDPDAVNGPLEGWLVRRIGRMGRAALRLIAGSFEVGAMDAHLVRSIKVAPLCVAGGLLSQAFVVLLLDAVSGFFKGQPLSREFIDPARFMMAGIWLLGVFFYRIKIWGGLFSSPYLYVHKASELRRRGETNSLAVLFRLDQKPSPLTRGDNRYPLHEIYAVGFSDFVLLPSLYACFWLTLVGLLAGLEGLALGLPPEGVLWGVAVGVPLSLEIFYLSSYLGLLSSWVDYRRSWLITTYRTVQTTALCALACTAMLAVWAFLIKGTLVDVHPSEQRPWVAWLGGVHLVLVFDVALYMLFRMVYVRRRFDVERVGRQKAS